MLKKSVDYYQMTIPFSNEIGTIPVNYNDNHLLRLQGEIELLLNSNPSKLFDVTLESPYGKKLLSNVGIEDFGSVNVFVFSNNGDDVLSLKERSTSFKVEPQDKDLPYWDH